MHNEGILVLYNKPDPATSAAGGWQESDAGVLKEVRSVTDALSDLGMNARHAGIGRLSELPAVLAEGNEVVVFNLVERLGGCECDFNHVPAVCRAFGRSCTGGDTPALFLTFDKWLTKQRLLSAGLASPAGILWDPRAPAPALPDPPYIVKPVRADGSEGIGPDSVCDGSDPGAVARAVRSVHEVFHQPALVEEYIEGRELNVSVMEREGAPVVLPISEVDFSIFPPELPHIVDYSIKWRPGTLGGVVTPRKVPARIDDLTRREVEKAAVAAWHTTGCRDYARIDFRLAPDGRPYILEVNVNPDISPLAGLPASLKAAGIMFPAFIATMVGNAYGRRPM